MLATICEWIEAIVSVLVNIFAAGYVLGRIIAYAFSVISDALVEFCKIVASCAICFYEDVKMFMLDIDYQYGHIIKMLNTGVNNFVSDIFGMVRAVTSSITWFSYQTKSEVIKTCMGLRDLSSHSLIGIRDWFVLIGSSIWMLLMCIPNLLISIIRNILMFAIFVSKNIIDSIKLITSMALDSISKALTFFTSIPLQSVCGFISIYLIMKYRRLIFSLLHKVYRAIARLIRYSVSKICHLAINALKLFAVVFIPIRTFLPNIWRLGQIHEDYVNPSACPSKTDMHNLCVICHDKIKLIVLLPCRHLCLCRDCFKQLRRYRQECPMCREPYHHSIQVYA